LRLLARERRVLDDGKLERADRVGDDPAWSAVRAVVFEHEHAPPAGRVRRRGGATYEQALGAILSSLAGTRQLARVVIPPVPKRTCDAIAVHAVGRALVGPSCSPSPAARRFAVQLGLDGRIVGAMPPTSSCAASSSTACAVPRPVICVVALDREPDPIPDPIAFAALVEVHVQSAQAQAQHFFAKYGDLAREAIAVRWNAAVARFASVDDVGAPLPPKWVVRGDLTSDSWSIERVSSFASSIFYDDPDERAALMAAAEE
jgi:hypothetical protein